MTFWLEKAEEAMADEGLQAVSGHEGKGSLHPKMEKNLYSRWFRIEGAPRRVSFCRFYGLLGGKRRRGVERPGQDPSPAFIARSRSQSVLTNDTQ